MPDLMCGVPPGVGALFSPGRWPGICPDCWPWAFGSLREGPALGTAPRLPGTSFTLTGMPGGPPEGSGFLGVVGVRTSSVTWRGVVPLAPPFPPPMRSWACKSRPKAGGGAVLVTGRRFFSGSWGGRVRASSSRCCWRMRSLLWASGAPRQPRSITGWCMGSRTREGSAWEASLRMDGATMKS